MIARFAASAVAVAFFFLPTSWAAENEVLDPQGSPGRCAICGQPGPCQQKVCRIICGVEKVKKSYWCVESEDVCTMLPSHPGQACDPGCENYERCEKDNICEPACSRAQPPQGGVSGWVHGLGHRVKPIVPPQPGRTRSIKKLVKKEYEVERPVYRAVVQYVCAHCLTVQANKTCDIGQEELMPSPAEAPGKSEVQPAPQPVAQTMNLAPLPPSE